MIDGENKADEAQPRHRPRRDEGITFIEILVAIVLLGTVVVAVLAALGSSIRGSVTQEDQVKALSVLEAASSAVKEQGDCADYESRARAAVADSEWASRLTVTADCTTDPDFDRLTLEVAAPRGLEEQLTVLVGGPRVADSTITDDDIDELVVVTCAVTGITASPPTVVLDEIAGRTGVGALSEDIEIIATTDAECTGGVLRARMVPAPEDDSGAEIQPAFVGTAVPTEYRLELEAGILVWTTGPHDLSVEFERSDTGASIAAGGQANLFDLTCLVDIAATPSDPLRASTGQLQADVSIEVSVSDACPVPTGLTFEVDASLGTEVGSLTLVGDTWEGVVPGESSGGAVFDPGPTEIRVLDQGGAVIQTLEIAVQP